MGGIKRKDRDEGQSTRERTTRGIWTRDREYRGTSFSGELTVIEEINNEMECLRSRRNASVEWE